MRRSRRGGSSHSDFASSGEDSFVAVVVTKLTGALLFILLLTMVIMALLPKAVDLGQEANKSSPTEADSSEGLAPLQIATPAALPDAIAGRPYVVALAATGGHGPLHWSAEGTLPEWLALDESTGRIGGTPPKQSDEPLPLRFQVSDGKATASQPVQLLVLPGQIPTTIGDALRRLRLPSLPSRAWLEQGVGFLMLWLVHLLGMNLLANLERGSLEETVIAQSGLDAQLSVNKRFATYRLLVRLATLSAMIGLAAWLVMSHASAG
jgi:flagellar biogenesis protein FliO